MARFSLQDVILPKFEISLERKKTFIAEVEAVLENTLALRAAFAARGRELDTSAWKLVRTKDDVRAYRSRRVLHAVEPRIDASSSSSSTVSTGSYLSENIHAKKTVRPPAVVLSGTVDGTAEDAVLGMFADSEQHCLLRQSYMGTDLEDSRLLFRVVAPTSQNPFTFIGVKWGRQTYGRFSQPRDFVFLEATGIIQDASGDSVSYGIRQSTDLSEVLTLPRSHHVRRGHLSVCQTFANQNPLMAGSTRHSVEMFSRAFLQMDGDVLVNVAASAFAEKLMAFASTMECATAYKLTWRMRQCFHPARSEANMDLVNGFCTNCMRSLGTFKNLLLPRGGTCQVCRHFYCGKCSVFKKIAIGTGGNDVMQKSMLFCLECLLKAKHTSAREVAIDLQKWHLLAQN
ncbi:hypothetical protein CCR75_009813 [Bremia lactucae]|uniref:FYVE-type domain-containing protein n=1 Tax=Bremia lactucae TaxID=4779 RepID=A0A976IC76_BRELC|nr:hypothetical protein CCR75_009813 [Bremia lactucae]